MGRIPADIRYVDLGMDSAEASAGIGTGSSTWRRSRRPEAMFAPAIVAGGIALLPILIPPGPGNVAPVDMVLLGAIGVVALWAGTTGARLRFPYVVHVTLFAIAGLGASLLGPLPIAGLVAVAQDVFLFLWCLAVANVLRTPRAMRLVLGVWSVSATVWATALVLSVLTAATAGIDQSSSSRASFSFGEQNGAALYLAISLMVILAARIPVNRAARFLTVTIIATAIVLTGSLAGLAGLLAGVVVTILFSLLSRRGLAAALLVLFMFLVLAATIAGLAETRGWIERAHESPNQVIRDSIGRLQQSSSERATLASEITGLYRTDTLFGVGPTATEYTLRSNQSPYPKEAHNDFVAALIERGLLGELAIIALVGAIIVYVAGVWRVERSAPDVGFRTVLPAPLFLVGATIVIAVGSLTHEVLHDRTIWTLLGLVAAVALWAGTRDPKGTGGTWAYS
jgi:O-antigen ligase